MNIKSIIAAVSGGMGISSAFVKLGFPFMVYGELQTVRCWAGLTALLIWSVFVIVMFGGTKKETETL